MQPETTMLYKLGNPCSIYHLLEFTPASVTAGQGAPNEKSFGATPSISRDSLSLACLPVCIEQGQGLQDHGLT